MTVLSVAIGLGCSVGSARAQGGGTSPGEAGGEIRLDSLPVQMQLGVRVEERRRKIVTLPALVIVEDPRSYVEAIAAWTPELRFPVLIDDGSWETRENLGRFARAMGPGVRVVRWKTADVAWPGGDAERQGLIGGAAARAWGAEKAEDLPAHWREVKYLPPGIVAADAQDAAWTAALALAAGHGQPIAWVKGPAGMTIDGAMTLPMADALSKQITAAAAATGLKWDRVGDTLDALSICLNTAGRVQLGEGEGKDFDKTAGFAAKPGESFALSDVLGRHPRFDRMDRWAWAGQIFGNEAAAAYRSMCALFLEPSSAWLFNGYEVGEPWDLFSLKTAQEELKPLGMMVQLDDSPRQSAVVFRDGASGGWASRATLKPGQKPAPGGEWAGLISVNTMGNPDFFDLRPGRCLAVDAPILGVPAAVNFTHSWSAQQPGNPSTIAGKFFRHGAYLYIGSVHEPFLHAFAPPSFLFKRWRAPAPIAAAARIEKAPMWRVTVLGDPLMVLGKPGPRAAEDAPLPLKDDRPVRGLLGEQLKAKNFADGLASLALLGRDAEAVRLARALLDDPTYTMTPAVALAALGPAFRQTDAEVFERLWPYAETLAGEHPDLRDLLWHAWWPSIGTLTPAQVDVLGRNLRPEAIARDAEEVAKAKRRLGGQEAAARFLDGAIAKAPSAEARKELERIRGELIKGS